MIKKIFQITLFIFIIVSGFTISNIKNDSVLRTNLEIEDISHVNTSKIYFLNHNNLLVGVDTFITGNNTLEKAKSIIEYLKDDNNNSKLKGYLNSKVKILNISLSEGLLEIDFSKELLDSEYDLEIVKTGLVYSLVELSDVSKVLITIDGQYMKGFTKAYDKNIGINKEYLLDSRKDILKVVIYYLDDTLKNYIPVTKYLNDNKDKIEVIIRELKEENDKRFVSLLDEKVILLDYKEIENVMFLNFNDSFINNNSEVQEKLYKMISYAVFDNYDVGMVMFEVNGKALKQVKKNSSLSS